MTTRTTRTLEPIAEVTPPVLKLRGPQPPYRVCPTCHTRSLDPWENPLLVEATRQGRYTGETTGGSVVCEGCDGHVTCVVCQDTGWKTTTDREGIERVGRCECWKLRAIRTVQGLPTMFRDATLENYDRTAWNATAVAVATEWVAAPDTDLYLFGGVGVGKTRLLCSLLNAVVAEKSAAFVRVPELLDRMRMVIGLEAGPKDEHDYLELYRRVEVVGLDDIGADKGSDYGRRVMQTLYDHRLDRGLRTLWTSNLDLDELGEFLGDERLSSRIAGHGKVICIEGVDKRVLAFLIEAETV